MTFVRVKEGSKNTELFSNLSKTDNSIYTTRKDEKNISHMHAR